MITCIIPAYNESERIDKVISVVLQAKKSGLVDHLIIVSDGSTDETVLVAKKAGANQIISYHKNYGKAHAILEGLKAVQSGDILLLDADLINLKVHHLEELIKSGQQKDNLMTIGYMSDDLGQKMIPYLSGQRFIKRKLVDKIL